MPDRALWLLAGVALLLSAAATGEPVLAYGGILAVLSTAMGE